MSHQADKAHYLLTLAYDELCDLELELKWNKEEECLKELAQLEVIFNVLDKVLDTLEKDL